MPGVTRYKVLCQEVGTGQEIALRDEATVLGVTESLGSYRVWYLMPVADDSPCKVCVYEFLKMREEPCATCLESGTNSEWVVKDAKEDSEI